MIVVTPFFAAILGVIFIGLSINVMRYRLKYKTSLGSGDNKEFDYAIRAQANFVEYVPLSLLMMWFIESLTLSGEFVFWLGSVLVLARVAHAFGMFYPRDMLVFRQIGALGTIAVLFTACVGILEYYLPISI